MPLGSRHPSAPCWRAGKHSWGCYGDGISGQQVSAQPVESGEAGVCGGHPRPLPGASSDCQEGPLRALPGPEGPSPLRELGRAVLPPPWGCIAGDSRKLGWGSEGALGEVSPLHRLVSTEAPSPWDPGQGIALRFPHLSNCTKEGGRGFAWVECPVRGAALAAPRGVEARLGRKPLCPRKRGARGAHTGHTPCAHTCGRPRGRGLRFTFKVPCCTAERPGVEGGGGLALLPPAAPLSEPRMGLWPQGSVGGPPETPSLLPPAAPQDQGHVTA